MTFIWRIYYENGSTFSDTDGEPWESPAWGVVALAQPDADPPIMVNADWMMWRTDRECWEQCGSDGFDDHAVHHGHVVRCWRKTRWIPTPDFREIWKVARRDCGLKE